jgi:ABC-type sugar transport system permease subunit
VQVAGTLRIDVTLEVGSATESVTVSEAAPLLKTESGELSHNMTTERVALPMALPFIMLAVLFRGIENFKMFDLINLLTSGGPGSTTEVASITLKRDAFESWRTGYSSAFAIILFVTVFGLANIYVKALNHVKNR